MESTEITSPSSRSASRSATSVFPTAVGPASSSSGAFMARLRQRAAQREEKNQTGNENSETDQVRLGRPAAVEHLIIASEEFHERPQHSISHQVRGEHLTVEFAALEQPRQEEIQRDVQQRFVNFRRMNSHAAGLVILGKMDRPRDAGRRAVAATV